MTEDEKLYIETVINEHETDLIKYFERRQLTEDCFTKDHLGRKVYRLYSKITEETVQFNIVPYEKCIQAPDYGLDKTTIVIAMFKIHFPGLLNSKWRVDALGFYGDEYYIPICNLIHEVFVKYLQNKEG